MEVNSAAGFKLDFLLSGRMLLSKIKLFASYYEQQRNRFAGNKLTEPSGVGYMYYTMAVDDLF